METTRHPTATVYVVDGDETLLHDHKRQPVWMPPGGHVDRDELPHETAIRETREETGLDVDLVGTDDAAAPPTVSRPPQPHHYQVVDIDRCDGDVVHQHVDLVFYARTASREVVPGAGEVPADRWAWFGAEELERDDRVPGGVAAIGQAAIDRVGGVSAGAQ